MKLVIVACTKQKLDRPAPAAELYTSTWFKAARAYAERFGDRWAIVSAMHALVLPETELRPYEHRPPTDRLARYDWMVRIHNAPLWGELTPAETQVIILAGHPYSHTVHQAAMLRGFRRFRKPLERRGYGEQVQWMQARVAEGDDGL